MVMQMERWQTFNNIIYFILKLMYVNVLWILFTFVGLVIFGLFPATGAMFSTIKKLVDNKGETPIFRTFWQFFRKDFFMLNGHFIVFAVVIYFIYFDIQFLLANSGKLTFLYPVVLLISLSALMTLLFFFPVFAHFKLTFLQYVKQAFLIAVTNIVEFIFILLSLIGIGVITYYFPGVILILPASVFAYLSILFSNRAFEKISIKKS